MFEHVKLELWRFVACQAVRRCYVDGAIQILQVSFIDLNVSITKGCKAFKRRLQIRI